MEYEKMMVKAGDLLPGSYWRGNAEGVFERVGWPEYVETFRLLCEDPEKTGPELPLHAAWMAWCERRFGYRPTGEESESAGALWRFEPLEANMRRLIEGFRERDGYDPSAGGDPPRVVLQGDGCLPLMAGNKRVALIRLWHGLEFELEVVIDHREDAWRRHRWFLANWTGGKERLYQPVPHPDFRTWEVAQPCTERWAMIEGVLGAGWRGRVLDVGCQTGWFCRAFAEQGADATGVDENQGILLVAEIMGRYRRDGRPQARYVCSNSWDFLSMSEAFDVCLYLSLVMHTFQRLGADAAWGELKEVSRVAPVMFLDCVWGGYSAALPFTQETIAEEIIRHTHYREARLLGYTWHERRPFYVFSR